MLDGRALPESTLSPLSCNSRKVELRECGIERGAVALPATSLRRLPGHSPEGRVTHRGVDTQCLCQRRPPSTFSQVAVFETQHSHLAPRVQAVLLVQQPLAAGELNSSLACTTAPAFSTAVRIVFDVSAILSCSRAASWVDLRLINIVRERHIEQGNIVLLAGSIVGWNSSCSSQRVSLSSRQGSPGSP
jgi:hypothetical protein